MNQFIGKLLSFGFALLLSLSTPILCAQFIDIAPDYGINIGNSEADEGSGASFVDFNQDGWDDVSLATTDGPPRFFINQEGAGFEEIDLGILPEASVDFNMLLWVDYDNDNDLDLFLSGQDDAVYLFQNDGELNLSDVSVECGLDVENTANSGACWGDVNNDGLLDLYLTRYHYFFQEGYQYENRLFLQNDDHTFTDITSSAGVANQSRNTYHAVFWDYNEDGWLDIFIANDLMNDPNFLFENNGDLTFTDVSEESGLNVVMNAMSATIGDFDKDQDMDLFISNTGEGNHLYENNSDGTFTNIGTPIGVAANSTCWGAIWTDYNNDGWLDLFTGSAPLNPQLTAENFFFESNGGESFTNITEEMGMGDDDQNSYAVCQADFNKDGLEDILISPGNSEARLYQNISSGLEDKNWVSIGLTGTYSNHDAIGARFKVYCDEDVFYHSVHCGEGYISQHSQRKHIGLGYYQTIDSLEILWPRGLVEKHYNLDVNAFHDFIEGETLVPDFPLVDELGICPNSVASLNIEGPFSEIQWSNGMTGPTVEIDEEVELSALCIHESGISFQTDTLSIILFPDPSPQFTVDSPTCNGDDDASISFSGSNVEVQELEWFNFGVTDTLDGLDAGFYSYQGVDENGCNFFGDVMVVDPPELSAEVTIFEDIENCFDTWSGDISADGGVEPYSFSWNLVSESDNIDIDGGSFECFPAGIALWQVLDANGCNIIGSQELEIIVGIDDYQPEILRVYPNPASDFVVVDGYGPLFIFDITGSLIHQTRLSLHRSTIDLTGFLPGIYILWNPEIESRVPLLVK